MCSAEGYLSLWRSVGGVGAISSFSVEICMCLYKESRQCDKISQTYGGDAARRLKEKPTVWVFNDFLKFPSPAAVSHLMMSLIISAPRGMAGAVVLNHDRKNKGGHVRSSFKGPLCRI